MPFHRGAVARLSITSRTEGKDSAWRILVEGGTTHPLRPEAGGTGTHVEVRDIFYVPFAFFTDLPQQAASGRPAALEQHHILTDDRLRWGCAGRLWCRFLELGGCLYGSICE